MKKDYLIKKWLVDKLTDSELKDFESMDDFDLHSKIVNKAKLFDISEASSVKNYAAFKEEFDTQNKPVIKLRSYQKLYRIAGIFIIAIGVYFLFFFNSLTTVQTLAGQQITFELPDASEVILNTDSQAEFSKNEWDSKRELTLSGEAFFKVEKGSKFDVKTNNGIVSVLGTQFNVKARNNYFEVTCFEGVVGVSYNGTKKKLTKGSSIRILNHVLQLDSVKTDQPKWLAKISNFKAVPLAMVIEEFERQYDIDVDASKIETNRIFTGSFANDDLEQALLSITVPFNLKYKKYSSNKISLYKSEY